ncbi:shikimate kinase [Sphingosinicella terrae]|uniref:shikimate kinase n=1 Tax=Sphingosinicella terrae TaxID=2172047 RepID=UPI000E0CDD1E|nr:shikimate kinase [Sphingosinicella terrae]
MKLVFLYGPPASGKLTVGREIAKTSGLALFHNHLVVDAVASLFPFGSPAFVRLRELFWIEAMTEAACAGRSLVFTFAPEPTVAPDFPERLKEAVTAQGGEVAFVRLTVARDEQEQRLVEASRAEHGKLRDVGLLRALAEGFEACDAAMPAPALTLDTGALAPAEAAARIVEALELVRAP